MSIGLYFIHSDIINFFFSLNNKRAHVYVQHEKSEKRHPYRFSRSFFFIFIFLIFSSENQIVFILHVYVFRLQDYPHNTQ